MTHWLFRRFNFIFTFAALIPAFGMLAGNRIALASDVKPTKTPSLQSALPEDMFRCTQKAQCTVVQGWCTTFAINRAYLSSYDKIPNDADGKGARNCPPGWLPPLPIAVCESKRCKIVSGHPEQ